MNHFFVTPIQISENKITITGNDFRHIKQVLRMNIGDEATFSDGINQVEYHGIITGFDDETAYFDIIYIQELNNELPAQVYLFQSLPKADKMELIIQKAVELGIHEIIPINTTRSIVRLNDKKAQTKIKRWQAISEAAAKQCKRGTIPLINNLMDFGQALKTASGMDLKIIPYEMADNIEDTKKIISAIKPGQTIAIFIGAEGGFAKEEIDLATKSGITPITMGKRILRTETAALVILSWIMYHLEI